MDRRTLHSATPNIEGYKKMMDAMLRGMDRTIQKQTNTLTWPSERIAPGGIFHTGKVKYSKETADLIKLLMQESKVSMMVRKQVDYHLRNGEPLTIPKREKPKHMLDDWPDLQAIMRSRQAKRKNLQQILDSGAYEVPKYRPPPTNSLPSEKAKVKLQEKMCGFKMLDLAVKPKRRPKSGDLEECISNEAFIDELLDQINERIDWLQEMEELGEGAKYRNEVKIQIADRLRRIKKLSNQKN